MRAHPPLRPSSPRAPKGSLLHAAMRTSAGLALGGVRRLARIRVVQQALTLGVLAGAVVLASMAVRASVEAETGYRVSKASLRASDPPPGLAVEALRQLTVLPMPRTAGDPASSLGEKLFTRSFSLYDGRSVPLLAQTYRGLPWVRSVRSIEVFYPATVRFELVIRRPLVGLAHAGETYLLDEEGVVLPTSCYSPGDPDKLRIPTIVGAPLGRTKFEPGMVIADAPVRHGTAVALALRADAFEPLRTLPVRVDVSNVDGRVDPRRSEIVVTAGGTVIEWGRSPASGRLSIPVAEKVRKLKAAIASEPGFAQLSLVRLQFDELEVIRVSPAEGSPH